MPPIWGYYYAELLQNAQAGTPVAETQSVPAGPDPVTLVFAVILIGLILFCFVALTVAEIRDDKNDKNWR